MPLSHWRIRGLVLAMMGAVAMTAPMNALRVAGILTISDLLAVGVACIVVAGELSRPRLKRWGYFRPLILSAILIVYGGLLGTLVGVQGLEGLGDLVRFSFSTIGVLTTIALWGPSRPEAEVAAWMFCIGAALNASVGLIVLQDASGRAIGFSVHSNHLAISSLLAFGTAVGFALANLGWRRYFSWVLSGSLVFGMLASGSRVGMAGLVAFAITLLLITRSWRLFRWGALSAAGFVLLLIFGVVELTETNALGRLFEKDPTVEVSNEERRGARIEAFRTIEARPLTGVGFSAAKAAHNVYVQVWAAAGVLGILGIVGLVVSVARMAWRIPRESLLLASMLSSYVGYLVAAAYSTVFWDRYLWLHLAITVALYTACENWNRTFPDAGRPAVEGSTGRQGRGRRPERRGKLPSARGTSGSNDWMVERRGKLPSARGTSGSNDWMMAQSEDPVPLPDIGSVAGRRTGKES
jgi:O-antigen ligase